jgi:hypothetical protein
MYRAVSRNAKGSAKGTVNREQEKPRTERYNQAKALECVSKMPEAHFRAIRLHFCVEKP